MARAKNFFRGLGASYLLILVNTLWTLVSLPVALHYLERPEYTIWLIAAQMAGYLAMIDAGTAGSGIRLLVDHKDAPDRARTAASSNPCGSSGWCRRASSSPWAWAARACSCRCWKMCRRN